MNLAPVFFRFRILLLFPLFLLACLEKADARIDTVVIDAGHGGHDRGGIPTNYVTEKNVALDVALRLRNDLREAGFRVVMTRTNDVFIPLSMRCAIANAQRRAVFVSIHFNSAANRDARGVETYYYGSGGGLAASIHRRLTRNLGAPDRRIRSRRYFVLRNTRIPAVLVECGFLTNRYDASLALKSGYRARLAQEIANAIIANRRSY
ncbi:MAG TPA: N-acetylmuramoyl-L-alanine amidase [Chthoniobacterales bacterium]